VGVIERTMSRIESITIFISQPKSQNDWRVMEMTNLYGLMILRFVTKIKRIYPTEPISIKPETSHNQDISPQITIILTLSQRL
jgi:hypothetical protein